MNDLTSSPIPRFQYHLSSRSNTHFGWISADDKRGHRIGDLYRFYRTLGYTEEARRKGLLPDAFIWFVYLKGHSGKSEGQLPAKIIEYLNTHSAAFEISTAIYAKAGLRLCNINVVYQSY
jgi:hypothetical protein